eukprot:gene7482-9194_t
MNHSSNSIVISTVSLLSSSSPILTSSTKTIIGNVGMINTCNNNNNKINNETLDLSHQKLKEIIITESQSPPIQQQTPQPQPQPQQFQVSNLICQNLRILLVNDNLLSSISVELIINTPQLEVADFSGNRLTSIPDEISQWSRLETLGLAGNLLTDLPNLTLLPSLRNLYLLQNSLPPYLIRLYYHIFPFSSGNNNGGNGSTNGGSNSLINNNSSSNSSLGGGSSGKPLKLDLENSNFSHFPFELEHVPRIYKLSRLTLGYNNRIDFGACSSFWGIFKNLKYLSIDHCHLNFFPEGICEISSLRRLILKKNAIPNIPPSIKNIPKLKRFDMSYNQLESIPPEFSTLTSLISLNFNNNRLKNNSGVEHLSSLNSLEKLNLNNNLLTEFPKGILNLRLTTLYLDHNDITTTPEDIKNMSSLKKFSINHNKLTSPPRSPYFQSISFVNNPIPDPTSPISTATNPSSTTFSPEQNQSLDSNNSPTSPLVISKKPPKPLPLIPKQKNLPLPPLPAPVPPIKPKASVPPLKLKATLEPPLSSQKSLSQSQQIQLPVSQQPFFAQSTAKSSSNNISNHHQNTSINPQPVSNGLAGSRVRSFTSYDYAASVESRNSNGQNILNGVGGGVDSSVSKSVQEGSLLECSLNHTNSSSSSESWQEEDNATANSDPLSPGRECDEKLPLGPPYTHRPKSSSSSSSSSSSKDKKPHIPKITDLFNFAKQSIDTIHFRKKSHHKPIPINNDSNSNNNNLNNCNNSQSNNNSNNNSGNITPRGGNPNLQSIVYKDECFSSPSTPRPHFPERNGSTSSLGGKEDFASTPRQKDPERYKRQTKPPESDENVDDIISHPKPIRTFSENNLEYNSPSSCSSPNPLSSSMQVETSQVSPENKLEALLKCKIEFSEEIFDEKNSGASFYKKRLSGLVLPNHSSKSSSITSNPVTITTKKLLNNDTIIKKNKSHKSRKSNESENITQGGNSGYTNGGLKSSFDNNNPNSHQSSNGGNTVTLSANGGSTINSPLISVVSPGGGTNGNLINPNLDGDDFIKDLMSSPIVNQDLEFTSEDGIPKIKTATLKMLISLLTHEKGQSEDLETIFFDTYTLFTNFDMVLSLLNDRFYCIGKTNPPIIKLKVLRFVKKWIDRNWNDFIDPNYDTKLLEFCKMCQENIEQGIWSTSHLLKNQITHITNTINMKRDGTLTPDDDSDCHQPPPIPDFIFQENFTLLDLKSHEIARQLTMIDHSLLAKISKKELLDYIQSQSNPPQSIVQVTNRFNYVSRWVASEITSSPTLEKRISIVFKFINIALNCWYLKNFNSATAIIAGMKHGAVCRLKTTWYYVNNSKANVIFQDFEEMISPTSIVKLRKIMDSVEAPSVPYLGTYFHHLVGITEGNKSISGNDQINIQKYEMIGKILKKVHLFQSKTYNLANIGVLQNYLQNTLQLTEDQLYEAANDKKEEKLDFLQQQLESAAGKFGFFGKKIKTSER